MGRYFCQPYKAFARMILVMLLTANFVHAQTKASPNWQNLDLKTDGIFGISMEKTYAELLKNRPPVKPVIVAVIDYGFDWRHEDLKANIWTNPKEIPGNGKDDDGNGYIDDIHGYNFQDNPSATNEESKIRDLVKQVRSSEARFKGKDSANVAKKDLADFKKYEAVKKQLDLKLKPYQDKLNVMLKNKAAMDKVVAKIAKPNPSNDDFRKFIPSNEAEASAQLMIVLGLKKVPDYNQYVQLEVKGKINFYQSLLDYYLKQEHDALIGEPGSFHGTHVSGIIAAVRNNDVGINGVASNVQLMMLPAIPGDVLAALNTAGTGSRFEEHWANAAKAIRYAVDNGAKVINMSFNTNDPFGMIKYTIEPVMDEAIRYAISKDVLIIHAVGNDHHHIGENLLYTTKGLNDGPGTTIEVGATGPLNDATLFPSFSNYSQTLVDVCAPGVGIYSTVPGNRYESFDGTSMATPVVAGLAGELRAYYPKLTGLQIKEILMKTVVKADLLKDKCITSGVVNAYDAFKLAETYK